jgi:glucokinase
MSEPLLGIDLGGTKIALAVVQDDRIISKVVFPTPREGWRAVFDAMIREARDLLRMNPGIARIGVGVPGPIDFRAGVVKFAPNIPGFENAPVRAALSEGLGTEIELENDANAAGLGEHVLGAGRGATSSIFITVSTGIGSGIILNDRVWRGANGIAGENGHVVSLPGGPVAGSNIDGALEAVASGTAIGRDASYAYGRPMHAPEVFDLARKGDGRAVRIVDLAAHRLGVHIADLQKVIDPEVFVVGGGVSEVGSFYLDKVQAAATEYARGFAEVKIRKAVLGSDAGVIGAALSARR